MPWLLIPTYILLILYIIVFTLIYIGWHKIPLINNSDPSSTTISVIIPFRNEASNLTSIINDLKNQTLPSHLYEVVFVNDHSEDNSQTIVMDNINDFASFKILSLPDDKTGKKEALQQGIEKAQGKLIVTTDADCHLQPGWLHTISCYYEKYKPKLIIGPVEIISNNGFFNRFQQIELTSLVGSTAGTATIGHPVMCNGANLAFEKSTYTGSGDPMNKNYASGDDIFLLQKLKKNYKNEIHFLKHETAVVKTKASPTLSAFVNQRKRWLSKRSGYTDIDIQILAAIVYLANLSIFISFFTVFTSPTYLLFGLASLLLKTFIDGMLYISVAHYYSLKRNFHLLLPFQFIYIIYVSLMPVFLLKRTFTWKDRMLKK